MLSIGNNLLTKAKLLIVQEVQKLQKGLNPHQAISSDKISARFLKEMAHSVVLALIQILQASYDQGIIPHDLKGAFVNPLYKKVDKSKTANYCPVTLTLICDNTRQPTKAYQDIQLSVPCQISRMQPTNPNHYEQGCSCTEMPSKILSEWQGLNK